MTSQSIGLALIAFVGYDLLRYTDHNLDPTQLTSLIKTGLIAGGILFTLWNVAGLLFVAPSRLVDTSIPHILVAKAILGPTGRIVIGVVAIAGACAAVNYLYQTVSRIMALMAHHRLLPAIFGGSTFRPVFPLFGLAATTGLLMTTGFAGSDLLDVSIRAGLILWLVFYALIHLACLLQGRRNGPQESRDNIVAIGVRHIFITLAMMVIATILVATDGAPIVLLKTISAIFALAACCAGGSLLLVKGFTRRPALRHTKIQKGTKS